MKIYIIILLSFSLVACGGEESPICESRRSIYIQEFVGKIMEKSVIESGGRPVKYITFNNSNNEKITLVHSSVEMWHNSLVGDSVYKPANSVVFDIYRNGKHVYQSDENTKCNFQTKTDSL